MAKITNYEALIMYAVNQLLRLKAVDEKTKQICFAARIYRM
jgi:hypothetical protein